MSKCYIPEISIRIIRKDEIINNLKSNFTFNKEEKKIICTNDGFYEINDNSILKYVILHKKKNYINFFLYQKGFIYTAGNKYNWNSNDLKTHLSGEDNPNRVTVFQTSHPLYHKIWNQIKDLVLKCIVPIYPYIQCPNINNQCYKFLGLDILIDDQYNLYLAEINSRLISLKYPPKNFKNDMYLDILNQVYFNKSKMIELIYTNQPTSYTLQSIYEGFSYKSNKIKNLIIVISFIIIITIIFIKIKYK